MLPILSVTWTQCAKHCNNNESEENGMVAARNILGDSKNKQLYLFEEGEDWKVWAPNIKGNRDRISITS